MNILHYSIGIYPDRSGGLVRYSTDLALEHSRDHQVYYLIPGKLGIVDKRVRIVEDGREKSVTVFRIQNALPVPIYSGIRNVDLYTRHVPKRIYADFLSRLQIDILFVHSFMGLHVELLQAAREKGIRVVMITHDFFGICPVTTLFRNGKICENTSIDVRCSGCSCHAHSYFALAVGQSRIYKRLKKTIGIAGLRNRTLLKDGSDEDALPKSEPSTACAGQYRKLNDYYMSCYQNIDCFIFNSKQTREIFEKRLGKCDGMVIPLLHREITDRRRTRRFLQDGVLHVGFMGESTDFKGFEIVRTAIRDIHIEGCPIELDVYNDNVTEDELVKRKGKYSFDDLEKIYESLDIIVVPSIWYETLSFVVIEAISAGMPCLVSEHVGARELIEDHRTGFIVRAGNIEDISSVLRDIISKKISLEEINRNILEQSFHFGFQEHCKAILDAGNMMTSGEETGNE